MINLLPPQQKEELQKEENFKIILILGLAVLVFLISLFLVLFTIKVSLLFDLESQKIYFEVREKELKSPGLEVLEEKIKEYNLTLSKLNNFYQNEPNLTGILEKISKTLPAGTYLNTLSVIPQFEGEDREINCSLSGRCLNRETLLKFKENLEKTEGFKEVYFPPGNWVKPTDIDFSVNFKVTK